MAYSLTLLPSAQRALSKLDRPIQRRISRVIDRLAHHPRPPGARKLSGKEEVWRVRTGDYRILYSIHDRQLIVLIIDIGHRREIYR